MSKKETIVRITTDTGSKVEYPNELPMAESLWRIEVRAVRIEQDGTDDKIRDNKVEFYYTQPDLELLGIRFNALSNPAGRSGARESELKKLFHAILKIGKIF